MSRMNVVKASKFEKLSMAEMQSVKGGQFCISCLKRDRAIRIGWKSKEEMLKDGTPLTLPY